MEKQNRERGRGYVYQRGEIYWVCYYVRGECIRESAKTNDKKQAEKFLVQRLKQRDTKPVFIGPKEEKWDLNDLEKKIEALYLKKQNRSFDVVQRCLAHVKEHFEHNRLVDITTNRVEEYQQKRLKEGAARATVNRECAYLRLGFRLMLRDGEISSMPVITLLDGEFVRRGFIGVGDCDALLENIPDMDVRDIVEFLYHSGWRSKEAKTLEWPELDFDAGMIYLLPEKSKNKKPRALPMVGRIREILERRVKARDIGCPYVFHRNGKPIKSFRKAFKAAAREIGQPDLIPHDMRRSAVRNFRKSGLGEQEGMMLSGHRTNSVYQRYNIIDEHDLTEVMKKAQKWVKAESKKPRTVVPLRKQA